MATPDAPTDQLRVQNATTTTVPPITFVRVRDSDFPHPDEPTPSELNDSDQENITPPIQAVSRRGPSIRMPLGVTDAHILSYFSVFYTDLFYEVFVFESLSLIMIRWLVTCCHHVHSQSHEVSCDVM